MMKNSKKNEAVNILCIKEWAFYIFFFPPCQQMRRLLWSIIAL